MKESPMKSKAQRPTKKTKEQERSKERNNTRESDPQQNADLQQKTNLQQNTVLQQNGFNRSRQIGPKTLLIQSTLFGPTRPKSFCIK